MIKKQTFVGSPRANDKNLLQKEEEREEREENRRILQLHQLRRLC